MMHKKLLVLLEIIAFLLIGIVLFVYLRNLEPQNVASEDNQASLGAQAITNSQIIEVIDGDTVIILFEGEQEKVRLVGINTPETKYAPQGEQCLGADASAYAQEYLDGAGVMFVSDPTQAARDQYGRLLGYIVVDGEDFGLHMLRQGFAREFTYDKKYQNQEIYREAEQQAKAEQRGIWGEC